MSTRRTTRASSRAASVAASSSIIGEDDIPTLPRRQRSVRSHHSTNLSSPTPKFPNIRPRVAAVLHSTAYGDNTLSDEYESPSHEPPGVLDLRTTTGAIPSIAEEIENELLEKMDPTHPGEWQHYDTHYERPRRDDPYSMNVGHRSKSQGVGQQTDASYGPESSLFGPADVGSSSAFASPFPLDHMRLSEDGQTFEYPSEFSDNDEPDTTQSQRRQRGRPSGNGIANLRSVLVTTANLFRRLSPRSWKFMPSSRATTTLFVITIVSLLLRSALNFLNEPSTSGYQPSSSSGYHWYGADLSHNVGQFVPKIISSPLSYFSPSNVRELEDRIRATEYEIAHLARKGSLEKNTLADLEKMLPDAIVCKRDSNGEIRVPDDFWEAIKDKIAKDPSLKTPDSKSQNWWSKPQIGGQCQMSEAAVSKLWTKFLNNNQAKITSWSTDEFERRFPQKLDESLTGSVLSSKADVMKLISKSWADSHQELRREIGELAKQLVSADDVKKIAASSVNKLLGPAQLKRLANSEQRYSLKRGMDRPNYFARGMGAFVDPYLTSPNYAFPSMQYSPFVKGLAWIAGQPLPVANTPEFALMYWREHGDCWCSPATDHDGYGPSLGVLMGHHISPDNIIVEHISKSEVMEPGATPKEMELLAFIEDADQREKLKRISLEMDFSDLERAAPIPFGYVRIASWTYDKELEENFQSFPVQLDLFHYGVSTNKLIVRIKRNWSGNLVDYTCLYRVRINGQLHKTSN